MLVTEAERNEGAAGRRRGVTETRAEGPGHGRKRDRGHGRKRDRGHGRKRDRDTGGSRRWGGRGVNEREPGWIGHGGVEEWRQGTETHG